MAWFQKISLAFFTLAFALIINIAQAQYDPNQHDQDARDMLERCQDGEAVALVVELMKDEKKQWNEVLQKVASGSSQWIDTSACLWYGVRYGLKALGWDGDYAWETLMDAWSAALLKNPEDLLKQSDEISISLMCSFPTSMFDGSVEFADDFLEKALTSLERVDDGVYLQARKEACKTYLKFDHERYVTNLEEYKKPH